jgi:8-oxo-dGTP diphosphatase
MTTVVVTAAVIEHEGRFLVTRRQPGVHLAGYWEFPGGKCPSGEALSACIVREVAEELNVRAIAGPEVLATTFAYEGRTVELHFLRCAIEGEPVPQQGQEVRWVTASELRELDFPPADAQLIQLLTR